jgi:GntR family transcriptional repressor for pyruvate dehydrogenase complex
MASDESISAGAAINARAGEDHRQPSSSIVDMPAGVAYRRVANGRLHLPVVEQIAESIISGQLAPGSELPSEQELGQSFGVSRTVIRAALALLETLGLVDISHGKRSTVRPELEWDFLNPSVLEMHLRVGRLMPLIDDIFHTRLVLEVAAVEEAAKKASPEALRSLRQLCDEMDQLIGIPPDKFIPRTFHSGDTSFHQLLAGASGSRVLRRTLLNLSQVIQKLAELRPLRSEEVEIAVTAHRRIYECVSAGDAAGAAQIMREHIRWAWERWHR